MDLGNRVSRREKIFDLFFFLIKPMMDKWKRKKRREKKIINESGIGRLIKSILLKYLED